MAGRGKAMVVSSDAVKEEGSFVPSVWKGKGRLLKEESREAIVIWPSDVEEEPILVLDDDDDATTESSGYF